MNLSTFAFGSAAGPMDPAPSIVELLRRHGIHPSAQRVAVGQCVLFSKDHPSADEVWRNTRAHFPMLARATVYNTLNLFVQRGLLRQLVLAQGHTVFDPRVDPHHHFVDEETGRIVDLDAEKIEVRMPALPAGMEVHAVQVVLRGKWREDDAGA